MQVGVFFIERVKMEDFKNPTTTAEQINILQSRGLILKDIAELECFLNLVNYYRLGSYLFPFRIYTNKNELTDKFKEGTSFSLVKRIYNFDEELKLLLFRAITTIEITLRRHIAHYLCLYKNESQPVILNTNGTNMLKEVYKKFAGRQKDKANPVIKRCAKYNECGERFCTACDIDTIEIPPLWAVIETFDMGDLCNLYTKLTYTKKYREVTEQIVSSFGLNQQTSPYFKAIIDHLRLIRNKCAHNELIWVSKTYQKFSGKGKSTITIAKTISFIFQFIQVIDRNSSWLKDIHSLISETTSWKLPRIGHNNNQQSVHTLMGFDKNWPKTYDDFAISLNNEFLKIVNP